MSESDSQAKAALQSTMIDDLQAECLKKGAEIVALRAEVTRMSDAVIVTLPKEDLEEISALLKEASEDISVDIAEKYPEDLREIYPTYRRRYERDMELVRRINGANAKLTDRIF